MIFFKKESLSIITILSFFPWPDPKQREIEQKKFNSILIPYLLNILEMSNHVLL